MHEVEPWATAQSVTNVLRESGGVNQEPVDMEIIEQPRVARGPEGNGSIPCLLADVTPRGRARVPHDADAVSAHEGPREGADDAVSDELPVLVIVGVRENRLPRADHRAHGDRRPNVQGVAGISVDTIARPLGGAPRIQVGPARDGGERGHRAHHRAKTGEHEEYRQHGPSPCRDSMVRRESIEPQTENGSERHGGTEPPQEEEAIGVVLIETEPYGGGGDHGHHGDQGQQKRPVSTRAEKDHQGRREQRDGETRLLEESKTEQRVGGAVERGEADSLFGELYIDLLIEEGLLPWSFDARLRAEQVAMADVRERTAVNEADSEGTDQDGGGSHGPESPPMSAPHDQGGGQEREGQEQDTMVRGVDDAVRGEAEGAQHRRSHLRPAEGEEEEIGVKEKEEMNERVVVGEDVEQTSMAKRVEAHEGENDGEQRLPRTAQEAARGEVGQEHG